METVFVRSVTRNVGRQTMKLVRPNDGRIGARKRFQDLIDPQQWHRHKHSCFRPDDLPVSKREEISNVGSAKPVQLGLWPLKAESRSRFQEGLPERIIEVHDEPCIATGAIPEVFENPLHVRSEIDRFRDDDVIKFASECERFACAAAKCPVRHL